MNVFLGAKFFCGIMSPTSSLGLVMPRLPANQVGMRVPPNES
jgi:hypothetical protein